MLKKIVCTGLLLGCISTVACAFSFGIDSPSIHLTTRPGSTQEQELVVYNQSPESIAIKVSVEDWVYREDRTKKFMKKGESPFSCAEWVVPEKDSFTLTAGEKKKFKFTVKTPAMAEGGHQAVLFFEGIPAGNAGASGKSGVLFSGKVGAILYQHTEGKTQALAELSSVSATEQSGLAAVSLQFKNTGNDWIQAKGNAVLLDDKGKTVGRGECSPIKTLPGETVASNALVKGFVVLPNGTYKVLVTVDTGTLVLVKETSVVIGAVQ